MFCIRRALWALIPLALLCFAAPTLAQSELPFYGKGTATVVQVDIGDCFDKQIYTVDGTGSPLGDFFGKGDQRVDYCTASLFAITGEIALFSNNSDGVYGTYRGTTADYISFNCELTITNGFGVYAGAGGSATLLIYNYSPGGPFIFAFNGTLTLP